MVGTTTEGSGRLKAAWTLVVLAPLCAEAALSGIAFPALWLALPLLVPMYGAGVLLARELVVRAGAGLPGLLLMGLAYELVEDGIGLQALTSTRIYTAAEWGPRVLGLNTTYWESQIGYHVVFSVLIPVVLADLLFPDRAGRPYLRRGGLIGTGVAALVGVAIVRFLFAGTEDPGYQVPAPALAGIVVAVVIVTVLALVGAPRIRWTVPAARRAPSPVVSAVVAGVVPFAFLALLFPAGHAAGHPATGEFVVPAMVVAAVMAVGAGVMVLRWVRAADIAGRGRSFRIWTIGGAMVGHSLYGVVGGVADGAIVHAVVAGAVVIVATVGLLVLLARRRPSGAAVPDRIDESGVDAPS